MADQGPNRVVCGIIAIFLGGLGIHKFMLGNALAGVIQLVLGCIAIGGIIGVVEGILYLTKSDEEFYQQYVVEKKAWF